MNDRQHAPAGELAAGRHSTYWSDAAWRDGRRVNLYKHFVRPGSLAFDIGANCGEVTLVLLELGCRVVAVEPQAAIAAAIDPRAEVVVAACGATVGEQSFYEIPANPYLSTMSRQIADFNESTNGAWSAVERQTPVVTLDSLIERYGVPAFTKIDVEGFELEVFAGLSQALPALSFEVHSFDASKAGGCVARLEELGGEGGYGYLYSPEETYELQPWPPRQLAWFGDVYATHRTLELETAAVVEDSQP